MKTKMTKAIFATLLMLFFTASMFAQTGSVGINNDGSSPNSKAMLDVSSTTKGFLPPRMTYSEKIAIASPPAGLIVWCSNCGTSGELQIYNGTTWVSLNTGTASGLPGAPTIGTATAGNAQASVPFTAPASNGGSTILSYTATSSPGSVTGTLTQAGSGTITVNGLTNGTAYTFTVTATNATGTGAASAASNSVTPVAFVCGQTLTDIRDSKVYTTVLIGTQCWMAKNLNVGTRITGGSDQTNNSILEKYCYSNIDANCTTYGGLYQWNEMMQYSLTPGVQGICPSGWHLPTTTEWTTLKTYLDPDAGYKMRETGTTHWTSPNTGATNSSGFTGLGGGLYESGAFKNLLDLAQFWSSTYNSGYPSYSQLYYASAPFSISTNFESSGYSVRCLKDN
jgi:uncharacterized protein (TIGR02145 family)